MQTDPRENTHVEPQGPASGVVGAGSNNGGMSITSVGEIYRESFRFRDEPHKPKSLREQIVHITFVVLCFCSFILIVVGTPLDMFRNRSSSVCVTLWGSRATCGTNEYKPTDWGCADRTSLIDASRAFAIFSILFSLVSFILGALMAADKVVRRSVLLGVLSLGATVSLVLAWGCVAGVYNAVLCETATSAGAAVKETHTYGAGFALIVAAFCFQSLATIVGFFA